MSEHTNEALTDQQNKLLLELGELRPGDHWLIFINAGYSMADANALLDRGLIDYSTQMGVPTARLRQVDPAERRRAAEQSACEGLSTEALEQSVVAKMREALRKAIQLAEIAEDYLSEVEIDGTMVSTHSLKAEMRAALPVEWIPTPEPQDGEACDHVFSGWRAFADGNGGEQVCTKCGMGAMAHDLRQFGPG